MHEKTENLFSQYEADKIHMNSTRWRTSLINTYNSLTKVSLNADNSITHTLHDTISFSFTHRLTEQEGRPDHVRLYARVTTVQGSSLAKQSSCLCMKETRGRRGRDRDGTPHYSLPPCRGKHSHGPLINFQWPSPTEPFHCCRQRPCAPPEHELPLSNTGTGRWKGKHLQDRSR